MNLEQAIEYLGPAYVFYGHGAHDPKLYPQHSAYALVDVRATVERVKSQRSFADAVEKERKRLRLIHGRVAA